jgi:hypothetical protein
MTEEELLAMPLHEVHKLTKWLTIRRVVGGWIYTEYSNIVEDGVGPTQIAMSNVFVPEDK